MTRPRHPRPDPSRRDFHRHVAAGAALVAGAGLLGHGCSAGSTGAGGEKSASSGPPPAPPARPAASAAAEEKRSDKLRILILGGTGFLGPAVVEAAQARGHTLTLFNRGKTNPGMFPDVEKLQGDRDGQLQALEGRTWEAVVDTSGYVPRLVKMSADFLSRAVEHYTFISTISVYAGHAPVGSDESWAVATTPDPTSEDVPRYYGALKALSEKAAEAAMSGRVCTIRPGLIVGPRDRTGRFTYWPLRVARGGEVLAPGTGSDPVQYIDVRDLAAWIIQVIEKRVVGVYNALGPADRLEMAGLLAGIKQAIPASDARFTWVPTDFLDKQGVSPWSDMPVWFPPTGEESGAGTMSNARAVARGLTFRPIADTTTATLEWVQSLDAAEKEKATRGAGIDAAREAAVLKKWHAEEKRARGKARGAGKGAGKGAGQTP